MTSVDGGREYSVVIALHLTCVRIIGEQVQNDEMIVPLTPYQQKLVIPMQAAAAAFSEYKTSESDSLGSLLVCKF
jgi:hypothetical protein